MGQNKEIWRVIKRLPGQSLRERRMDCVASRIVLVIAILTSVIVLVLESSHLYFGVEPSLWFGIVMCFLAVICYLLLAATIRQDLDNIRKGEEGELLVAQAIERDLVPYGYRVIHDIVLEKDGKSFNVDHLVIGENGIFAIETKNYTKPSKGTPEVIYDGKQILWNGKQKNDEVGQASMNAKSVKELIDEITGLRVYVVPVLCAVGWYVSSSDWYGNPVLLVMDKMLYKLRDYPAKQKLSDSDRNKIEMALIRRCYE